MIDSEILIEIPEDVFNPVYREYLDCDTELQIFFGGSSSGKSVFVSERTVYDLLKGDRNYLIIRKVSKSIRSSVFNEIKKLIGDWGLDDIFDIHNSDFTITNKLNGFQIIFKGLDDVQKIKSVTPAKGVITDIWIEEATETAYNDYKELIKRLRGLSKVPKRIIFTFNPIMKTHWIFKEFFAGVFGDNDKLYHDDKILILKTTHLDNEFLTQQDRDRLENETNEYFYEVYTLGNWGVLGDLVFTNYVIEDISEIMNELGTYKNGLDFGFTNDPTAGIRASKRDDTIYITHCFHGYGMTNSVIDIALKKMCPLACEGEDSQELILADNYPKDIWDLRHEYNNNIFKAFKPPGSVNSGINWMKDFKIVIHNELQEVINEFQLYQWSKNKDGESTNIPVDKFNHLIDALRYAFSQQIFEEEDEEINPAEYGL